MRTLYVFVITFLALSPAEAQDSLSLSMIKLVDYAFKPIKGSSTIGDHRYTFVSDNGDSIILFQKAPSVFPYMTSNWCQLELDSAYDFVLQPRCKDELGSEHIFYSFVKFRNNDCSLFLSETYESPFIDKQTYSFTPNDFVDDGQRVYQILELTPCRSQKIKK